MYIGLPQYKSQLLKVLPEFSFAVVQEIRNSINNLFWNLDIWRIGLLSEIGIGYGFGIWIAKTFTFLIIEIIVAHFSVL
jgi:hypothetical protein